MSRNHSAQLTNNLKVKRLFNQVDSRYNSSFLTNSVYEYFSFRNEFSVVKIYNLNLIMMGGGGGWEAVRER